MTGSLLFWALASALAAACLAIVMAPLRRARAARSRAESDVAVYRDQLQELDRDLERGLIGGAEADAARAEITRRMLAADAARAAEAAGKPASGRAVAAALALGVPLIAVPLYLAGGTPGLPSQPYAERIARAPQDLSLEELVARAEDHLRANPDDAEGWRVVAPIYSRMGRYEEAADAYSRVLALEGEEAGVLARLGEALAFANDGIVSDRARAVFERARDLDPSAPQPRYFLGLAAVQAGDTDAARAIWQRLADEHGESTRWRRLVDESLAALDTPSAERAISALPAEERAAAIQGMVDGLDARLAAEGGTVEEWLQLVRARLVLGQREAAESARARAFEAYAGDPAALARIADGARALGLGEPPAPQAPEAPEAP